MLVIEFMKNFINFIIPTYVINIVHLLSSGVNRAFISYFNNSFYPIF